MKKVLKKVITVILTFSVCLGVLSISAAANESEQYQKIYYDGLAIDDEPIYDWNSLPDYVDTTVAPIANIPTSYDLSSRFPTPGNQGNQ